MHGLPIAVRTIAGSDSEGTGVVRHAATRVEALKCQKNVYPRALFQQDSNMLVAFFFYSVSAARHEESSPGGDVLRRGRENDLGNREFSAN